MKAILKSSTFALIASFFLTACDAACVTEKQVNIPQAGWHKDSVVRIALPIEDTLSHCAVLLTLRNSDNYPYNNIILSVTAVSPEGETVKDTVEYRLIDDHEAWTGKQGGKWIDHRLAFRIGSQFRHVGEYEFQVAHLMRNNDLPGVGAVGVRIERMDK